MFVKLLPVVHSAVLARLCQEGLREPNICEGPGETFFLGKDARVGIMSLVVFYRRLSHHNHCAAPICLPTSL